MTSAGSAVRPAADAAAYRAVEHIYHSYLTGLILMLASRVRRSPRRRGGVPHLPAAATGALPSRIEELGLDQLPHAVACAQYHYLSNQVGGVKVEYVHESDRKAWVRYPPPRWIWSGTAICGIRRKYRGRCCADGTPTTASCSAIPGSASSAPGRPSTASRGWRVLQGVGSRSRPRSGCSFRPASAVRRSRPISPRLPGEHGPRNGCRRCFAIMRWSTSPRSCRKRSGCSVRKRAAISPAPRRGSSGCTPSTRSLRCWRRGSGRSGFRQGLRPAARGQDDDAELQLEGSTATVRQTSWRLMAEREALSPRRVRCLERIVGGGGACA